jgi:high-affinity iron transporter
MKSLLTTLLLFAAALPGLAPAAPDLPRLVQLIDYVGVDYRGAVENGKIISAAEYGEMRDFAGAIVEQTGQLSHAAGHDELLGAASRLRRLVEQQASADAVATAAAGLRHGLIDTYDIVVVPRSAPDPSRARLLYAENCASCHGAGGHGDGVVARAMAPPPTNFVDANRYGQRTLYGLYSTITSGIGDTAMRGFPQLSEEDRWSLAFLVGQLAVTAQAQDAGKAVWSQGGATARALGQLEHFTVTTPDEAREQYGQAGADLMAYLRTHPEEMFANASPLDYARKTLTASLDAYRAGERDEAYRLAVAAYLDGFELVEHGLDAVDAGLRRTIENEMTRYRSLVQGDGTPGAVEAQAAHLQQLLGAASARLGNGTLSSGAAFAGSFIIMVREGLEALLVIAALAAFLVKTGRRDGMPYLHLGWGAALLLGLFTWLASVYLIEFSGSSREITEGVAALIAMAVLFYVGFWLHSKTNAMQWKRFIEGSVRKALSAGTLWGLAGLAFIAVYREVFETILFYQALWIQAAGPARGMLVAGVGGGAVVLVILGWLIMRYSTRLPLRQFFSATSVFMFVLAIVFAGKGIAALQEAGRLPVDPINFPRIDLLGIYPNLQVLAVQGGLLLLAAAILWGGNLRQRQATTP